LALAKQLQSGFSVLFRPSLPAGHEPQFMITAPKASSICMCRDCFATARNDGLVGGLAGTRREGLKRIPCKRGHAPTHCQLHV